MVRVSRGLTALGLLAGVAVATTAGFAGAAKDSDTFGDSKPVKAPVIIAPPPAEVVAEAIRAECDAFARRMDACTRLRQIAIETGDDKLLQQTDELERQAAAMYQARIARLGVSTKEPPRAKAEANPDRRVSGVDPLKVGPPTPMGGSR